MIITCKCIHDTRPCLLMHTQKKNQASQRFMLVYMSMIGRREAILQFSKRRQSTKHATRQLSDVIAIQGPLDNLK